MTIGAGLVGFVGFAGYEGLWGDWVNIGAGRAVLSAGGGPSAWAIFLFFLCWGNLLRG
jgi:hypothetical protein